MKSWTYQEITDATEKELRSCAEHAAGDQSSPVHVTVCRGAAVGALGLWRRLTASERIDGDFDRHNQDVARLDALAQAVGATEKPASADGE